MVIPLYNKKKVIQKTLLSVCSQTYDNFDIIVVDDGSTDGSAKHLSLREFNNLKIIYQANLGQSAARNTGIKNSSADYIAFLDADDLWKPDHLQNLANLVREFPSAGIYASSYISKFPRGFSTLTSFPISDSRLIKSCEYFEAACNAPVVWVSAVMVPKKIFEDVGLFLEGEHRGADREMWGRILLKHKLAYNPQPTAIYCNDISGQETKKKRAIQFPPLINTLSKAIDEIEDSKFLTALTLYKYKVLMGHLSKAVKDAGKEEINVALKLLPTSTFSQKLTVLGIKIINNSSHVLLKIFFKLRGSRYFFYLNKNQFIKRF